MTNLDKNNYKSKMKLQFWKKKLKSRWDYKGKRDYKLRQILEIIDRGKRDRLQIGAALKQLKVFLIIFRDLPFPYTKFPCPRDNLSLLAQLLTDTD